MGIDSEDGVRLGRLIGQGCKAADREAARFSVEEGIWKCGVCMVLNQKGGTKCADFETE